MLPDFDALYSTYTPYVWAVCRRLLRNDTDAEDCVQETFLRAVVHFTTHEMDLDRIKAWLARAATNIAIDLLRRRRDQAPWIDEAAPAVPPAFADPLAADVQRCLDGLTEEQRLTLLLKRVEGLKWEEIIAALNPPPRTVDQVRYLERQAAAAMLACLGPNYRCE